jgi:hypothetical protein
MKTASCPKCGLVVDLDNAPRIPGEHKGKLQETVQCPVCSAVIYREIDKTATSAADYDDRTEEQKIMAKAAADAKAKLDKGKR